MLLFWDVTSSAGAKNYYAACLAPGRESDRHGYFSEGQETPGLYDGKLAEMLGLAGKPVDEASFNLLCDNINPATLEPLTPRTKEFRRVCKDATFSGPKSFSIIEAFASEAERRDLRRAFDESATETIAEDMEPDMQTRVRKGGANDNRVTGNALTASFDHATARPEDDDALPDMHWHKHVLFWNATYDAVERRIKAGQLGDVVRDKAYYRAAFYSRLASKLEALGYVIDRRGGNEWEIAGVPQSAIDKFSKRTTQIDAEAERRSITDAAVKAGLGAKLRGKKPEDMTLPELRRAWDAQLTDDERDALQRVYRREVAADDKVTAREAVTFAIDHLSEQHSIVTERELKRVALLRGLGDVTPAQIGREMTNPVHGLIVGELRGRRMATTVGLQAEEDEITGYAARGKGSVAAPGVPEGLDRLRPDGKALNDGQWAATLGLLEAENRYNLLLGPAGSGKTDLLKAYAAGLALNGETLGFLATTSDAVGVLQKDGFTDAKTVAHFLRDEKLQNSLRGAYVVVDEASMLGHKDALHFVRLAEKLDLRVLFVGDEFQHGSVPRGALLRLLKDYAGIRPFRLQEIMRQEHAGYRAAVAALAEGRTLDGFDALDALNWVKEIADDLRRHGQLAADYVQAMKDGVSCLVVSPTHSEAAHITDEIRNQLRAAGLLGAKDHAATRLVAVKASEAERRLATTYRRDDVLVFHQNAKGGHVKGDRLVIKDIAAVPLAEADKFSVYRPVADTVAVGDRIRFTGTVRTRDGKHTLKNGVVRTIAEITRGGHWRLDNGWVVAADAGLWRKGFVDTSFGAQGKTVKRVLLGMAADSAGAMSQENMYVSASRGREGLTLYTDDKDAVRSAIGRSSQKAAALDLRRALPQPKPSPLRNPWEFLKSRREWLRRLTSLDKLRRRHRAPDDRQPPTPPLRPPATYLDRLRAQQQERSLGHGR